MPNFRFSFQKILDLRKKETEDAQLKMAYALKKEATLHDELANTEQMIWQTGQLIVEQQSQVVSVQQLRRLGAHVDLLEKRKSDQVKQLNLASQQVSQSQLRLYKKMQEEKKWSHLREKKQEAFDYGVRQQEQKELDDVAGQRDYRFKREG